MNPDELHIIGEKLRNFEIAPSSKASFEEVMNRRQKKRRRVIFWWQSAVMASLIIGSLGTYYLKNEHHLNHSANPEQRSEAREKARNHYFDHEAESIAAMEKESQQGDRSDNEPITTQPPDQKSVKGVKELPKKQKNTGILGVFQTFNKQRKHILSSDPSLHSGSKVPKRNALNWPSSAKDAGEADLRIKAISAPHAPVAERELSPMALSNVFDFGAKNYIAKTKFSWNISYQNDDYIDWELQSPVRTDRYLEKPWYVELSAITGSNNQIQFDPNETISVLGTNYMAQYQLSLLKEFGGGDLWGLGIQYTQWVGNGEWRKQEWMEVLELDSKVMAVNIPNLPTQYYTQYDTVTSMQVSVSSGSIAYNIDKWSLPISHRGFFQLLKTPFRYAAHVAPGITRSTQGMYFTPTEFMPLERNHRFSLGAKISAGPVVPVGNGLSIALEPALMYQSFMHQQKGLKGNVFGGFGISMMWRLK
jgi:hypothetical protein